MNILDSADDDDKDGQTQDDLDDAQMTADMENGQSVTFLFVGWYKVLLHSTLNCSWIHSKK